ncbi:Diacylglycerol kinase 7 [Camellia lanceoleosa]|uniref:Diacylglycerol kinase 7 n=1 Tax=Camellia lanceoleosa TaxID=1840588 RepID=A0ACC0I9A2_9ERIC|nr:Diacylglycerol kinase 7 [Camellia lanceoleosa]
MPNFFCLWNVEIKWVSTIRFELRDGEWEEAYLQMDGKPWKQPMNKDYSTFVEIKRVPFQSIMVNGGVFQHLYLIKLPSLDHWKLLFTIQSPYKSYSYPNGRLVIYIYVIIVISTG